MPFLLQRFIDHDMQPARSMLILCGSSMGSMRDVLNEGDSPLFMRFPLQLRLSPLSYAESRAFHPNYDEADRIRAYAIAGGIPLYHRMLEGADLTDMIRTNLLGNTGPLVHEAENALVMELRPWTMYERVLEAMANGPVGVEAIRRSSGLSKSSCINILGDLVTLGIVSGGAPYGKKHDTMYRISDGLLSFYLEVIVRNASVLANDPVDPYESLRRHIEVFFGRRFEEVCRQYVTGTRTCGWIGGWWGTVPKTRDGEILRGPDGKVLTEDTDVDIVANVIGPGTDVLVLCGCKFTTWQVGPGELRSLMDRGTMVWKDGNRRYILFSRSGFTSELMNDVFESRELYGDDTVELVDLDVMASWADGIDVPVRR